MTATPVILLSCGSYNPPTNMHLRMFEIARDYLHRMGTHVVVAGVISPVHDSYGKKDLTSAKHRCAMLQLALNNSDWIRLSTWESRQNNWTKTRLILQHHQNLLNTLLINPNENKNIFDPEDLEWIPENIRNGSVNNRIQIKLLCGADLLESFGVPNLWDEKDIDAIIGQHGLIVITREGSNPNKFIYESDILSRNMKNITIVTEWISNEISSTKIRRALRRGESIKYLIPDRLIDYIYDNNLYDAKTTSSTTKLIINSNNYLHINSKYENDYLTPSPNDVTMTTPSPVEIITIDVIDPVILKKNIQNSPKKLINQDTDDNIREQFINVISDNGNKLINKSTSTSNYPGQAKQIITTETGDSQIFSEVGKQIINNIDDKQLDIKKANNVKVKMTNSIIELNDDNNSLINDGSIATIKFIKTDISLLDKKSQKILSLSSEGKNNLSSQRLVPEFDSERSSEPIISIKNTVPINLTASKQDDIDGKVIKSKVNSRKSPNKVKNQSEQVVPMMEGNERPSVKSKKATKSSKKNYQGSLDSLNSTKLSKLDEKSKSFEFIKGDLFLKEIEQQPDKVDDVPPEKPAVEPKVVSYESPAIDEHCSVCCYDKNICAESNNSSPLDVNSTECEICSSYNFATSSVEPQCEICEICGDVAIDVNVGAPAPSIPEQINEEVNLPGESNTNDKVFNEDDEEAEGENNEIDKVEKIPEDFLTDDDSTTIDDVEFEIENCGLEIIDDKVDINNLDSSKKIDDFNKKLIDDNSKSMSRGSSLINRNISKLQSSKRLYSSVDNLPSFKPIVKLISEETIKSDDNKINSNDVNKPKSHFESSGHIDNIVINDKSLKLASDKETAL